MIEVKTITGIADVKFTLLDSGVIEGTPADPLLMQAIEVHVGLTGQSGASDFNFDNLVETNLTV